MKRNKYCKVEESLPEVKVDTICTLFHLGAVDFRTYLSTILVDRLFPNAKFRFPTGKLQTGMWLEDELRQAL